MSLLERIPTEVSESIQSQPSLRRQTGGEREEKEAEREPESKGEGKEGMGDGHLIEKMEAHLVFMEKEMAKSLAWQKELLAQHKVSYEKASKEKPEKHAIMVELEPH